MSLQLVKDLIRQHNLTGTAQEIADALNAKTETVTNDELYTVAGIIKELGPDAARGVIAAFEAVAQTDPLLKAVYYKITSTGISFADPDTVALLEQLKTAGVFTQEQVDAMKSIGFKKKSKWELAAGDGAVIDADTVAAALNDNPTISRQVLVSAVRQESGTSITLVLQELADGKPSGNRQTFVWRTGQPLPDDPVVSQVISSINQALSAIEV
ncbi:MAG: hypothetical protein KatS3mg087_0097 [Patescibacteria group bacterium]|nr:MAG: hypothetical protein KatS3mg087_0097 [Patescibacteria group bacterium]